jgi:predicted porin
VPLGAGEFKASYIRGKGDSDFIKGNQIALGYVYNLSKRTAVYTTYARVSNSGNTFNYGTGAFASGQGLGNSVTGLDLGLRHSF